MSNLEQMQFESLSELYDELAKYADRMRQQKSGAERAIYWSLIATILGFSLAFLCVLALLKLNPQSLPETLISALGEFGVLVALVAEFSFFLSFWFWVHQSRSEFSHAFREPHQQFLLRNKRTSDKDYLFAMSLERYGMPLLNHVAKRLKTQLLATSESYKLFLGSPGLFPILFASTAFLAVPSPLRSAFLTRGPATFALWIVVVMYVVFFLIRIRDFMVVPIWSE